MTERVLLARINNFSHDLQEGEINPVYVKSAKLRLRRDQSVLDFLQLPNKTIAQQRQAGLIQANFPVIYMVSGDGVNRFNTVLIKGIQFEFAVRGGRAREQIPIILVPSAKID